MSTNTSTVGDISFEDHVPLIAQSVLDTLAELEKRLQDIPSDADGVEEAHAALDHTKALLRLAKKTTDAMSTARVSTTLAVDTRAVTRAAWANVASGIHFTRLLVENARHASTVL